MLPLNLYARVRISLCINAHETAGAARTRSSLRPFVLRGGANLQTSGAVRRENEKVCVAHPSRRAQERAPQDEARFLAPHLKPTPHGEEAPTGPRKRGPMAGSAPSRTPALRRFGLATPDVFAITSGKQHVARAGSIWVRLRPIPAGGFSWQMF